MGKYTPTYRCLTVDALINAEYFELKEREFHTVWGMTQQSNIPFKKVKISGFITNIYLSADRKYGFIIVDDGTSSVMVKFFKDALQINNFVEGDCVVVFGRVSRYNNEIHVINEEIIKIEDLNYFLLHRMEYLSALKMFKELDREIKSLSPNEKITYLLENYNLNEIEASLIAGVIDKEYASITKEEKKSIKKEDVKAQVIEYLKAQETEDGVEYSQLLKDLPYEEDILEEVVVDLLSEGSCYEPRPGRIKLL